MTSTYHTQQINESHNYSPIVFKNIINPNSISKLEKNEKFVYHFNFNQSLIDQFKSKTNNNDSVLTPLYYSFNKELYFDNDSNFLFKNNIWVKAQNHYVSLKKCKIVDKKYIEVEFIKGKKEVSNYLIENYGINFKELKICQSISFIRYKFRNGIYVDVTFKDNEEEEKEEGICTFYNYGCISSSNDQNNIKPFVQALSQPIYSKIIHHLKNNNNTLFNDLKNCNVINENFSEPITTNINLFAVWFNNTKQIPMGFYDSDDDDDDDDLDYDENEDFKDLDSYLVNPRGHSMTIEDLINAKK